MGKWREDRESYERCIMERTAPMLASLEHRLLEIFQTPDHVVPSGGCLNLAV